MTLLKMNSGKKRAAVILSLHKHIEGEKKSLDVNNAGMLKTSHSST